MEVIGGLDPSELQATAPSSYVGEARVHEVPTPFDDGFELRFVQLQPGARSRPHVSRSGRLIHVVAGEAVVADPSERVVVGRGDTVIVPAREWHWHGGLPHVAAVLLVIDRSSDVSFVVPELDWALGYHPAGPAGGVTT
jgi:quercetin dioxygenase-like cupin family protein